MRGRLCVAKPRESPHPLLSSVVEARNPVVASGLGGRHVSSGAGAEGCCLRSLQALEIRLVRFDAQQLCRHRALLPAECLLGVRMLVFIGCAVNRL